MKSKNGRVAFLVFLITFLIILAVLAAGMIKTSVYNNTNHHLSLSGQELFTEEGAHYDGLSVKGAPRSSTWTKIFDLKDEGLEEPNYQALTYDFTFGNETKDEVSQFTFELHFDRDIFLSSGWNGAVEIHQNVDGDPVIATIPDLRDYKASDYDLTFFTVDGESFVAMNAGDYLVYFPSSSMNAMEMPIKANEGTTPGFILYVPIGEDISDSSMEVDYKFHRVLTNEPLFWVAVAGFGVWLIALLIFAITSAQIKKYNERHERDNAIISESIETFTGFIDAKDPYTNGHSKRVATYPRRIAKEMGYEGEELDRIFYVALLHDCGKIGVPDSILGQPGTLTEEEFELTKSHTVRGGEILSRFTSIENVGEGARYHHERYDGTGYPEGRSGEDIPLIGRMICVADSYDAMNTDRVYRKKLSKERIIEELETNKGKQFDPKIADIMLRLIREDRLQKAD